MREQGTSRTASAPAGTRHADEGRLANDDQLMQVLHDSADAIQLIDGSRFVVCNKATARILGYPDADRILLSHPADLSPPEQPDGHSSFEKAEEMLATARAEGFHRFEWILRRADGVDFPVEVSLTPVLLRGRALQYCVWRDITTRKQAEERMGHLARAIEQSPSMVMITDRDGCITYTNPKFEHVTGYSCAEAVGLNPRILKSGETRPEQYQQLWSTILSGREWRGEFHNRRKDGTLYWEVAAITPLLDARGAVSHFLSVKEDITAYKQAQMDMRQLELDLRHSQKLEAVGQLAAGIAHEINTPAQFVGDSISFVREAHEDLERLIEAYRRAVTVLEETGAAPDLVTEIRDIEQAADLEFLLTNVPTSLDRAVDGVERISSIVRAMKEFAHPDQREQGPANLNWALRTTLTVARNEYKYVADVETDLGELPPVMCHIGDLNQVFLNLIVNAAHAIDDVVTGTGGKGRIRIRTRREDDNARIDISDTGSGIPEAIRHRIYEPFFTTKPVGRGSGQGLAIARSIVVDRHGGSLTYLTSSEGTTFTIRLPVSGKAARTTRGEQ